MAKKKCKVCGNEVEVRIMPWGVIYKIHSFKVKGTISECPGSLRKVVN